MYKQYAGIMCFTRSPSVPMTCGRYLSSSISSGSLWAVTSACRRKTSARWSTLTRTCANAHIKCCSNGRSGSHTSARSARFTWRCATADSTQWQRLIASFLAHLNDDPTSMPYRYKLNNQALNPSIEICTCFIQLTYCIPMIYFLSLGKRVNNN